MPFGAASSPYNNHFPPRQPNGSVRVSSGPFAHAMRPQLSGISADEGRGGTSGSHEGGGMAAEEDPRFIEFQDRFAKTEARMLAFLFHQGSEKRASTRDDAEPRGSQTGPESISTFQPTTVSKRPARVIDEDDYGDDDDDEDEEMPDNTSPLHSRSTRPSSTLPTPPTKPLSLSLLQSRPTADRRGTPSSTPQAKTADEIRKQAEESKMALEAAAERTSYTFFYTLEYDRDTMVEQQKLDELDRQVENEVSGQNATGSNRNADGTAPMGGLSSANLGSSHLAFKHLISRIDAKRRTVTASDAQLRSLMSEVRKGRSKWASDEKVGLEELYEACDKVLLELKAQTEYAAPFLQRVNKRDAPDYYNIIRHPMDIGTMIKKMKNLQYKSKKEFVDELNLIWANCLKYNTDPAHPLRRKALYMRKETEKLVPLIPDIVVRDRAEVEAEERRMQNGDADDAVEDSDDEEPIMASRGRKAPSKSKKGAKGTNASRKESSAGEGTPQTEQKPSLPTISAPPFLRADSEMDALSNGLATPPPGTLTPLHGGLGSGMNGSQADVSDADLAGQAEHSLILGHHEEPVIEDNLLKSWKAITKRARATVASDRHRLFRGDRLNLEEPALLRSKAGMRKWLRQQKDSLADVNNGDADTAVDGRDGVQPTTTESLAEGIEAEDTTALPDYYATTCAIPELNPRLKWVEDAKGKVIDQSEEFLRMFPAGLFKSPDSILTRKMEANMRQMQETRKLCTKIGVVKQMQLQSQMYSNQFQKHDPQPFVEADIEPTVVSEDGPIMDPSVCRATLQRSVAKIFYHAGFEDTQPSAMEAITDLAGHIFTSIVQKLGEIVSVDKVAVSTDDHTLTPRFNFEERILHALNETGNDLEALDAYGKEDMDRLNSKLKVVHERTKLHLAELLRPALDPNTAGADGAGAFNEGSEQFVQGDFAEEIGEDFFGFKDLGLVDELGLEVLSVPLHLLHNKVYQNAQVQNPNAVSTLGLVMDNLAPYEPVDSTNVSSIVGIAQDFFRRRLTAANDMTIVEDDDLPIKQRFPKPRLPPNGKITSPRKRPLREQQQMAKKKRKLDEEAAKLAQKPIGKLRLHPPEKNINIADPEKDDGSAVGMMSPESLVV